MTFSIFDIQSTIRDENKKLKKNKKISTDEDFGFESLSKEALQTLSNTNKQLLQASQLFCGLSGKDQTEFKTDFIRAIQQLDAKKFKEQAALYRQDIQKQKKQKWYNHQQVSLASPIFWKKIITNLTSEIQEKIVYLQRKWQTQKDYSHYNSLSLKHIAENIVPVFENYIELSNLELQHKGNRLPKKISKAFKQYLTQLQREINHEKLKLCWAMLGRLDVASKKSDLNADDVTMELTEALKKMGVIKSDAQLPEARRNLTSDCFEYFHSYIEAHGKKPLINRLKYLAWFRENENFISVQGPNQILLVPKVLQSFVPEKPSQLLMWFGGMPFRYQFLRERLALMTKMRFLDKHSVVVHSLEAIASHPSFKALDELGHELTSGYNNREQFRPNILQRLFLKSTLNFIEKWHHFLYIQCCRVLDKKIEFLHLVVDQIKTRLDFELDIDLLNSDGFKQSLKVLIENIEAQARGLSVNTSMLNGYDESKRIIDRILNNDITNQSDVFQEISEEEALTICPNIAQNQEEIDAKLNLQEVKEFLLNVKPDISLLEKSKNFVSELEDCANQIKEYKDKNLKILFNNVIEKCFLVFLQECIQWKEEECGHALNKFKSLENLLFERAPKSIRNRMASLNDLASKNQWYLWQLKCQSYLYSFDVDFKASNNSSYIPKEQSHLSIKTLSYNSSVRFFNQRLNTEESSQSMFPNRFSASNCQL